MTKTARLRKVSPKFHRLTTRYATSCSENYLWLHSRCFVLDLSLGDASVLTKVSFVTRDLQRLNWNMHTFSETVLVLSLSFFFLFLFISFYLSPSFFPFLWIKLVTWGCGSCCTGNSLLCISPCPGPWNKKNIYVSIYINSSSKCSDFNWIIQFWKPYAESECYYEKIIDCNHWNLMANRIKTESPRIFRDDWSAATIILECEKRMISKTRTSL